MRHLLPGSPGGGGPSEKGGGSGAGLSLWGVRDRAATPWGPGAWEAGLGAGPNLWAGPEESLGRGRARGRGQGRRGRGRARRGSAGQPAESGPLAGSSSQAWLRAVGAGGPGRLGLGLGCLLPGAPRVGAGRL